MMISPNLLSSTVPRRNSVLGTRPNLHEHAFQRHQGFHAGFAVLVFDAGDCPVHTSAPVISVVWALVWTVTLGRL